MAKFNKKTNELLEKISRLEASEKNYLSLKSRWRKDVFKAKEEGIKRAVSQMSESIDELNRAIEIAKNNSDHDLAENLTQIKDSMTDKFLKLGVAPFGSIGEEFDPHVHDAISSEEGQRGIILKVHSLGWADQSGDLIKPAAVIVGRDG